MDLRPCRKCEQEKPLSEFYPRNHVCKDCYKRRVRENRAQNSEYYLKYDRERGRTKKRRGLVKERAKRQRQEDPEAYRARIAEYQRRSKAKHGHKWKARRRVATAIANGSLVRSKVCEECGKRRKTQAHHEDYSKPLVVRWLCSACHGEAHRKD